MKPSKALQVVLGCVLLAAAVVSGGERVTAVESAAPQFETRCGWFINPTPANIWLYDRDGQWTIGVQGAYSIEEDWPWPQFKRGQWVRTNNDYGYGCVCMQLRVDKKTHRVLEIKSSRARPLATCRRDPALKKWKKEIE